MNSLQQRENSVFMNSPTNQEMLGLLLQSRKKWRRAAHQLFLQLSVILEKWVDVETDLLHSHKNPTRFLCGYPDILLFSALSIK